MREANRARCSGEGERERGVLVPKPRSVSQVLCHVLKSCSGVLVKRWLPSSKMAGSFTKIFPFVAAHDAWHLIQNGGS